MNALVLELYVGNPYKDLDTITSNGFYLFVNDNSNEPLFDSEGISLSPGFETDVVIKKTVVERQASPYSDCIRNTCSFDSYDSDLFKKTLKTSKYYTQKNCLLICLQRHIVQNCGCYIPKIPNFDDSRVCNGHDILECGYTQYHEFYTTQLSNQCFVECPQECDSIEYDLSSSVMDFPSPFYADLFIRKHKLFPDNYKNLTTFENIKQSVVKINIYFSDISYTSIKEVPAKTFEQLIGDLGGILGLCLGASLLSFIEIVELVAQLIWRD